MIEPLGAAGAASTAVGLTGFVFSTIGRVASAPDIGLSSKRRLKMFRGNLEVQQYRFAKWEEKWSQFDPQECWGPEGVAEIQGLKVSYFETEKLLIKNTSVTEIKKKLTRIVDRVRSSLERQVISSTDSNSRPRIVNNPNNAGQILPQEDVNLLKRLKLALYENEILTTWLRDATDTISSLEIMAQKYYSEAHPKQDSDTISIQNTLRLERKIKNFRMLMERAYNQLDSLGTKPALMFSMPTRPLKTELEDRGKLSVDLFEVPEGFSTSNVGHRFSVTCPLDPVPSDYQLRELMRDQSRHSLLGQHTGRLSEDLKECLATFSWMSGEHNIYLLKQGIVFRRAKAALCIASWAALGWYSHWMSNLCSCRIRNVVFEDGDRVACFRTPDDMLHDEHECHNTHRMVRPHLLLGLVLAELALVCPVTISDTESDDAQQFQIWCRETTVRPMRTDATNLTRKVGRSVNSTAYRNAVEYCMSLDKDPAIRRVHTDSMLRGYHEGVVEPLLHYYTGVTDERNALLQHYRDAEQYASNNAVAF